MPVSERRRQQNAQAQAKRRARVKERADEIAESPAQAPIADLAATAIQARVATPTYAAKDFVRAGQIAGQLEMAFRPGGTSLTNEDSARDWLDRHAVGASIVLELLSVAGVGESFSRWRAAR